MATSKVCTSCGVEKPLDAFHAAKNGLHGRRSYCKPCFSACVKRWHDRKKEADPDYFARKQREVYRRNTTKRCATSRAYSHTLKDAAYEAYGGYRCICCGETEPAFLCLDHINNDGYAHRKSGKIGSNGSSIYQWLKNNNYPPGILQVLCYNCNQGKRINGGVCPHQSKVGE